VAELVFLGTPRDAVPTLQALVGAGHRVALVITRADRRRGRGEAPSPTPVKAAAQALGIRVAHDLTAVTEVGAELGVVVAYGRIIPEVVLDRLPMVNVHFSLLPRWRGAAPIERALLAGDAETGVSLMALEAGLDTGPVYARRTERIRPDDTAASLRARLAGIGATAAVELLAHGVSGMPTPVPQRGPATYAEKLGPDDLRLDWSASAAELERLVRVGPAWTTFRGRRLRVLAASAQLGDPADGGPSPASTEPGTLEGSAVRTGGGVLRLHQVQPESRRPLDAEEWLRGARVTSGEGLGR